jgi:hypothetical protein
MNFELLIENVRDAVIDWNDAIFFDTAPKIIDGTTNNRLDKEDDEVYYHIVGGIYDPQFGCFGIAPTISSKIKV